jgi:hypothetical protein
MNMKRRGASEFSCSLSSLAFPKGNHCQFGLITGRSIASRDQRLAERISFREVARLSLSLSLSTSVSFYPAAPASMRRPTNSPTPSPDPRGRRIRCERWTKGASDARSTIDQRKGTKVTQRRGRSRDDPEYRASRVARIKRLARVHTSGYRHPRCRRAGARLRPIITGLIRARR